MWWLKIDNALQYARERRICLVFCQQYHWVSYMSCWMDLGFGSWFKNYLFRIYLFFSFKMNCNAYSPREFKWQRDHIKTLTSKNYENPCFHSVEKFLKLLLDKRLWYFGAPLPLIHSYNNPIETFEPRNRVMEFILFVPTIQSQEIALLWN